VANQFDHGPFTRRRAFQRLTLAKVDDGVGLPPDGFAEETIETDRLRGPLNAIGRLGRSSLGTGRHDLCFGAVHPAYPQTETNATVDDRGIHGIGSEVRSGGRRFTLSPGPWTRCVTPVTIPRPGPVTARAPSR